MTRVDIFATTIDSNGDAAKRVMALKDKQGWLLEWEQALRNRATNVAPPVVVTGANAGSAESAMRAALLPHDAAGAALPTSGRDNPVLFQARARVDEVTTAAPASPEAMRNNGWNPASYAYGVQSRSGGSAAAAAPVVTKYVPLPATMPTRVHFVLSPHGVLAYVRAYGLDSDTGERLMRKIRTRLRTLGMRLAKLVVNGNVVWIVPETVQAQDEIIISRED